MSASVSAFEPPEPKASVECTTAHFFNFSELTPKSAITREEYRSLGRQRKSQRLLTLVRLGSVPPIMVGMPSLAMVGEAAWVWVLRIGPMIAGISLRPPSFEIASTVPGLVDWFLRSPARP